MPDHTTTTAADYLRERGYTVSRGRVGGSGPPSADTIKHWCKSGKLKARKAGWVWLIAEEELERLVADARGVRRVTVEER